MSSTESVHDLNLDFDRPAKDLKRIAALVDRLNRGTRRVQMSFPFLFPHPSAKQIAARGKVFRTNVSLNQTFDEIGIPTTDTDSRNGW